MDLRNEKARKNGPLWRFRSGMLSAAQTPRIRQTSKAVYGAYRGAMLKPYERLPLRTGRLPVFCSGLPEQECKTIGIACYRFATHLIEKRVIGPVVQIAEPFKHKSCVLDFLDYLHGISTTPQFVV